MRESSNQAISPVNWPIYGLGVEKNDSSLRWAVHAYILLRSKYPLIEFRHRSVNVKINQPRIEKWREIDVWKSRIVAMLRVNTLKMTRDILIYSQKINPTAVIPVEGWDHPLSSLLCTGDSRRVLCLFEGTRKNTWCPQGMAKLPNATRTCTWQAEYRAYLREWDKSTWLPGADRGEGHRTVSHCTRRRIFFLILFFPVQTSGLARGESALDERRDKCGIFYLATVTFIWRWNNILMRDFNQRRDWH